MADALFSGTRQKILGFLFGQPETTYTLGELIERAQAGSGAVQREVTRLVASGLVREEGKARSRLYQANPHAPIFEELCDIARKLFGPEALIGEALQPLQDRLQVALLYGSVAKGEDRAGSDIDVLIVSDELLLEDIYAVLTEAENALGRRISPTIYTKEEFSQRKDASSAFLSDVLGGDYRVLLGELI